MDYNESNICKQAAEYTDLISRSMAMSHPFANGQYDHEHANPAFIRGYESYREWIESLPPTQSCCGYPLNMLAYLAGLIQNSGMTPDEFISRMRDSGEIARITFECIMRDVYEPIKEMFSDNSGGATE